METCTSPPRLGAVLGLVALCACASKSVSDVGGVRVLETGGSLGALAGSGELPGSLIRDGEVVVHGMMELPEGSRMSAARAGITAVTRAELIKVFRVEVTSLDRDWLRSDGTQALSTETRERALAELVEAVPVETGWARIQRGRTVVLRWVGRARAVRGGASSPMSEAYRPSWARGGDTEDASGHRFVCEGEGRSEAEALSSARAECEDKICKLCGVRIESVVETSETLDEVAVRRKVVERCRRIRQAPSEPKRKLVDCGDDGCRAFIQIEYPESLRKLECQRAADEDFDDPEACQNTILAFSRVEGWRAASFVRRIELLEQAKAQCAQIDVRPTPFMESMKTHLRKGMATWLVPDTPRWIREHWLAPHPSVWTAFEESPVFVQRLDVLLEYLRTKPRLLGVLECILVEDEQFDTGAGIAACTAAVRAAPVVAGYGVEGVHIEVGRHVGALARRERLTVDISPLKAAVVALYPPPSIHPWHRVVSMLELFRADGKVTPDEWAFAREVPMPSRFRFMQELLDLPTHEGASRKARFFEALERSLEAHSGDPAKAFVRVMPRPDAAFYLALESELPPEVSASLDFEILAKHLPRSTDFVPTAVTLGLARSLAARLERPDTPCLSLADRLEKLEQLGLPALGSETVICRCLAEEEARIQRVNHADLYRRALEGGFSCVSVR